MDRLTFLIYLSVVYDILSVWGVIQAVLLRLHLAYLVLLIVLLIVFPPLGFGLTLYVKFRLKKKKPGPKPKKIKRGKDSGNYLEDLSQINTSPPKAN